MLRRRETFLYHLLKFLLPFMMDVSKNEKRHIIRNTFPNSFQEIALMIKVPAKTPTKNDRITILIISFPKFLEFSGNIEYVAFGTANIVEFGKILSALFFCGNQRREMKMRKETLGKSVNEERKIIRSRLNSFGPFTSDIVFFLHQ